MRDVTYRHWQPGTLIRLAISPFLILVVLLAVAVPRKDVAGFWIALAPLSLAALVLLAALVAFHGLGTEVGGGEVRVWFGPGWIRKSVPIEAIATAEPTRNRWWMGWGIRLIGRRATLWSVSGLDAVELRLRSGETFRIGTDDAPGLDPRDRHVSACFRRVRERDVDDLVAAHGGHPAPLAAGRQLRAAQAEPRGEKAVAGGRRSAPLDVAEDGDPLDILVMVNEPTFSGCLIEARVVGIFKMRDKGQNDFKLLAVPNKDPLFGDMRKLDDVPTHFLREVEHFFSTYKHLEGVQIEALGWAPAADGAAEVRASIDRFRQTLGNF